ncbi:hypothetical protein MMC14_007337, partial [Varicellaria rhodocarpa]|nr:hypothetical protein [Varicellaria rhodocarpa]
EPKSRIRLWTDILHKVPTDYKCLKKDLEGRNLEGAFRIFGSLVPDVKTWQVRDTGASPEASHEFGEKLKELVEKGGKMA